MKKSNLSYIFKTFRHYFSKMRHYVFKHVVDKNKRIDGCSYFFLQKNQARDVTFLTLHYGKIKCRGFKTQDSRRVPIVKIESRLKKSNRHKNRQNCFSLE